MKNIILIGMPASGKSTVGVLIAKTLGFDFIDSDVVIQNQENRLLSEIIVQEGVDGFIDIENRVNAAINVQKTVVATGGSVIYGKEAMEHFSEIGVIVYLKLPYDEIEKRLGSMILSRGVVVKKGETLKELYNERIPLYEKYADYTVDCVNMTVEETVHAICRLAKKIGVAE